MVQPIGPRGGALATQSTLAAPCARWGPEGVWGEGWSLTSLALFHFVSREALQRHCHILDGGVLIPIGHSPGSMSADFVA
jgi:hypothetical protein